MIIKILCNLFHLNIFLFCNRGIVTIDVTKICFIIIISNNDTILNIYFVANPFAFYTFYFFILNWQWSVVGVNSITMLFKLARWCYFKIPLIFLILIILNCSVDFISIPRRTLE